MRDVPGDREHDVRRVVPLADVLDEVWAVHLLDQFDAPANIPAGRLFAIYGRPDEAPGPGARVVVVALQFLLYDCPLPVDFHLLQLRMEQHIGSHVERRLEAIVGDDVPVAGEFFVGVGVQRAAGALDLLGDDDRVRPPLCPLEDHVFQEVGDPVQAARLGAGTDPDEQVHGNGLRGREWSSDDPQAIRQNGLMHSNGQTLALPRRRHSTRPEFP